MYLHYDGASLPHRVGERGPGGAWLSTGEGGFLVYGPYQRLRPGSYSVVFELSRMSTPPEGQAIEIDVASHAGDRRHVRLRLACSALTDDPIPVFLDFALSEEAEVEARICIPDNCMVCFHSLKIYDGSGQ